MARKGQVNVIGFAVGALLAVLLLFIGYRLVTRAHTGLQTGEEKAKSMEEMIQQAKSLGMICKDWLSAGYYTYSAKDILEVYKIFEHVRPFEPLKRCCGEPLQRLAETCALTKEATEEGCAGNGMISATAPAMRNCILMCTNLQNLEEKCREICPEKVELCLYNIIEKVGDELCYKTVELSPSKIEEACGEEGG